MRPVLVLVDLQEDFLAAPGLEPHRDSIVAAAAELLQTARERQVTVVHVRTSVEREPDTRMPHWRESGRWLCVSGSEGYAPPPELTAQGNEAVLDKSGYACAGLPAAVAGHQVAIIAGVHGHACVRQAALDLHAAGMRVCIAREAIGSHEPAHAAHSEAYLRRRSIAYLSNSEASAALGGMPLATEQVDRPAFAAAIASARAPRGSLEDRASILLDVAELVEQRAERIAGEISREVGKPIRYARAEAVRAAALFRAVARRAHEQRLSEPEVEALVRRRPLGRVALITPWNNPFAIAAGQLAPAFVYGNAVAWKPAPAGIACARLLHELMLEGGIDPTAVLLIDGAAGTALELVRSEFIDGVCFTGSTSAGRVVAALCQERNLPLQAELGGNNGVIVAPSADLGQAAALIAEAAFGCAGQRCTATRRVIVLDSIYDQFVSLVDEATGRLKWGDPSLPATIVGPLLSEEHASRVRRLVGRATRRGAALLQPHLREGRALPGSAYHPPTILLCDQPRAEIVQEETFGPVLVVQRARDWEDALGLLNGVRQGLVAALFSHDEEEQAAFLKGAQAGILKLDQATVEAGVDVPFVGWKDSAMGPPQHGRSNVDFFTRPQTVYGWRPS